jgi:RNA polymerase sigma-70 factor, ECF subfamily
VNDTGAEDGRSDETLITAVNHGDTAAFEALYHRYRDWVVHMAFRFTGDRDLALDILQETFLYFSKKFPGFRLTAKLTTFLYPAVRNYSIAARRKRERFVSDEAIAETPAPAESGSDLREVLAQLPEEHREVLLLRFVEGLSMEEIGAAVRIPVGTVKSRLHYVLKSLRANEHTKKLFEA